MPINNVTNYSGPQAHRNGEGSKVSATKSDSGSAVESKGAAADTVSLTDTSSHLRALESAISASPAVDSDKVSRIKQALTDGSYEIDSQKIAEKLIKHELELTTP